MFITNNRYRSLFNTVTIAIVCLFLFNNMTWADSLSEISNSLQRTTLSPESRLASFFERNELNFKNIAKVLLATKRMQNLIASETIRESHIVRLNRLFPKDSIEIGKEIKTGNFSTGKIYRYAVFNFKREKKMVKALFIKDHDKLTDNELQELGIKTATDKQHFLSPELNGVWFTKSTDRPSYAELKQMPRISNIKTKEAEENLEFDTASEFTEEELFDKGIAKVIVRAQKEKGMWEGWFPECWDNRGEDALVLFRDGVAIGVWVYVKLADGLIQDNGLYIVPEERGKGLGKILRSEMVAFLKKTGYKQFRIGAPEPYNWITDDPSVQKFHEGMSGWIGVRTYREDNGRIKYLDVHLPSVPDEIERDIGSVEEQNADILTKIKVLLRDDAGEVSHAAADIICNMIREKPNSVLLLPTGNTPKQMYRVIAQNAKKKTVDLNDITIFMLDEYEGGTDYAEFIINNFINLLPEDNRPKTVNVLRGIKEDQPKIDKYVRRIKLLSYESEIARAGGVDLAVLGIGRKGHIGFNEQGSALTSLTHRIKLDSSTIEANIEAKEKGYTHALTSGVATILNSRKIILLATGPEKQWAITETLKRKPTDKVPSTWLKRHADNDVSFIIEPQSVESDVLLKYREEVKTLAGVPGLAKSTSGVSPGDASTVPPRVDGKEKASIVQDNVPVIDDFNRDFRFRANLWKKHVRQYRYVGEERVFNNTTTFAKNDLFVVKDIDLKRMIGAKENKKRKRTAINAEVVKHEAALFSSQAKFFRTVNSDNKHPNLPALIGYVDTSGAKTNSLGKSFLFEFVGHTNLEDYNNSLMTLSGLSREEYDYSYEELVLKVLMAYKRTYFDNDYVNGDIDFTGIMVQETFDGVGEDKSLTERIVFVDNDTATPVDGEGFANELLKQIFKESSASQDRIGRCQDKNVPIAKLCQPRDDVYSLCKMFLEMHGELMLPDEPMISENGVEGFLAVLKKYKALSETKEEGDDLLVRLIGEIKKKISTSPLLRTVEAVKAESDRIHAENLKYTPTIPDKTIVCHIITDSIVPVEQQGLLKVALEQNMKKEIRNGIDYKEGFAFLSGDNADSPDRYNEDLKRLIREKQNEYMALGYTNVRFDVACPDIGLVGEILQENPDVKALAFEPSKESNFDIVQAEGIMLALRVLELGDIDKLKRVFNFLTGNSLSSKELAITDISEFIRKVSCKLPAARVEDYSKRRELNDLITDNIRQAA